MLLIDVIATRDSSLEFAFSILHFPHGPKALPDKFRSSRQVNSSLDRLSRGDLYVVKTNSIVLQNENVPSGKYTLSLRLLYLRKGPKFNDHDIWAKKLKGGRTLSRTEISCGSKRYHGAVNGERIIQQMLRSSTLMILESIVVGFACVYFVSLRRDPTIADSVYL